MTEPPVICPSCAASNSKAVKFCTRCGSRLRQTSPARVQAPDRGTVVKDNRAPKSLVFLALIVLVFSVIGAGYVVSVILDTNPLATLTGEDKSSKDGDGPTPQILCAGKASPAKLVLETEPRRCAILAKDTSSNPTADSRTVLSGLEWSVWGSKRAIADGFFTEIGRTRARFELYDPRSVCGETVFTRFRLVRAGYSPSLPVPITSCIEP